MSAQLASLDALQAACDKLASCSDLSDVLQLQGKTEAVAAYFAVVERGSDAHALAWGLVQVSERRIGELTRDMPKGRAGRPKSVTDGENQSADGQIPKSKRLAELGLDRQRVAEWERAAALPEDEWRARVEAGQGQIRSGDRPKPVHAPSSDPDYASDECSTPPEYVEPARNVMGGRIELDPASNAYAQNVIQSERFHTKQDSGLVVPWTAATLWLNAPYSQPLVQQFAEKFAAELEARNFAESVSLWNSCTETDWFQLMLGLCDAVCFPAKRIPFWYRGEPIKSSNRYAQAFFYVGPKFKAFVREFEPIGRVLVSHNRRARR